MDLEDRARPLGVRHDEIDYEAVYGQVAEDLRVLNPAEFAGTERNVAEFTGAMKPRWRGEVTSTIFREVSTWIAETGYQPDRRAWFTGAQQFVSVTVPAKHRAATQELLDYDRLRAETERVNTDRAQAVAEFDLDKPENSVWYALAMRAHPLAMVHAAAALAAWVHGQPGAVAEVNEKRLELADRATKYLERSSSPRHAATRTCGRSPNRPTVAPWDVRPEPAPDLPTGEMVDVPYDGPPMTPWTAAYLWASMLTTLRESRRRGRFADRFADVPDPGDSPVRVLLARAISVHARAVGLTDDRPVVGPGVLSPMSLPLLSMRNLDPAVALIQFMKPGLGHHPIPGEPGYQAYREVYETIMADGVTAAEVLADQNLAAELDKRADVLVGEVKKANAAIVHAIQLAIPDVDEAPIPNDVLFGQLGGYMNDYLRATPSESDQRA